MSPLVWSWLLTALMLVFSWLCGKKVWWAWHYGLATQLLWIVFAVVTAQYGFIIGAVASSVIFARNAVEWSRDLRGTFPLLITHGEDGEPLAQGVLRSVEGLVLEDDEELDIY